MRRFEKYVYVILVILIVGMVSGASTYYFMHKNVTADVKDNKTEEKQEEKLNEKTEDGVKFLEVRKNGDEYKEVFEVVLNGKKNELVFDLKLSDYFEETKLVSAHYNDKIISEIFADKAENIDTVIHEKVKENFNNKRFKIITGEDNKKYLMIFSNKYDGYVLKMYILNDELEIINGKGFPIGEAWGEFEDKKMPWFNDQADYYNNIYGYSISGNIMTKIENNKIKVLISPENYCDTSENGILEEREYTIKNNILTYKKLNEYKYKNLGSNAGLNNYCE